MRPMSKPLQPHSHLPVNAETLIDDLLDRFPVAAGVFVRRRMHCVGCPMARFESVAEVCAIYRQPLAAMLAELNSRCSRSEQGA